MALSNTVRLCLIWVSIIFIQFLSIFASSLFIGDSNIVNLSLSLINTHISWDPFLPSVFSLSRRRCQQVRRWSRQLNDFILCEVVSLETNSFILCEVVGLETDGFILREVFNLEIDGFILHEVFSSETDNFIFCEVFNLETDNFILHEVVSMHNRANGSLEINNNFYFIKNFPLSIKMWCISLNHIQYKKSMVSSIQTLSYFTFKVYFANSSATPLVHRCERETTQDKTRYKWCQKFYKSTYTFWSF